MTALAGAARDVTAYGAGGKVAAIGTIVAFTQDGSTQEALTRLAEKGLAPQASVVPGGLSTAVTAGAPDCAVLLVDISDSPDPVADIAHLAEKGAKHIVATGPVNDVALYRALLAAGAADYVVSPVVPEELVRALRAKPRDERTDAVTETSMATAVIGARGGVGATTIAVSMGWLLAHDYGQRTALLDLDLQFGTCALALDLLPGRGLREVLESPDRIDSMFVSSAMVNESENLYVLGGEEPLEETLFLSPNGIGTLFAAIQPDFANIVIDLPRTMVTGQRTLLEQMTHILLVSDLSLSGMRDTVRLKSLARDAAPDVPLDIVIVEGQDRRNSISQSDFERGIEGKIAHVVPFDARTADEAASNGKAVPQSGGTRRPLVKSLRRITSQVAVDDKPAKSRKWFGK